MAAIETKVFIRSASLVVEFCLYGKVYERSMKFRIQDRMACFGRPLLRIYISLDRLLIEVWSGQSRAPGSNGDDGAEELCGA